MTDDTDLEEITMKIKHDLHGSKACSMTYYPSIQWEEFHACKRIWRLDMPRISFYQVLLAVTSKCGSQML